MFGRHFLCRFLVKRKFWPIWSKRLVSVNLDSFHSLGSNSQTIPETGRHLSHRSPFVILMLINRDMEECRNLFVPIFLISNFQLRKLPRQQKWCQIYFDCNQTRPKKREMQITQICCFSLLFQIKLRNSAVHRSKAE